MTWRSPHAPSHSAGLRDENERPIIAALQAAGCIVCQLSDRGLPDLLVMVPGNDDAPGIVALLEVKNGKGKLKPDQVKFFDLVKGKRLPVFVVRTAAEALEAVGSVEP